MAIEALAGLRRAGVAAVLAVLVALAGAPATRADTLTYTITGQRAHLYGSGRAVARVAPGFVGASIDYCQIVRYERGPGAVGVLAHLLGTLTQGRPLLRVGGEGPDEVCPRSESARSSPWAIATLARLLDLRLILGINLAQARPELARREVARLLHVIDPRAPRRYISAFELGNEPDLYPRFHPESDAPSALNASFAGYLGDITRFVGTLRQIHTRQRLTFAGPNLGRYGVPWISGPRLGNFGLLLHSAAQPQPVTFHGYPMIDTWPCPAIQCPMLSNLLLDGTSHGFALPYAEFAALLPPGRRLRVDEMNSLSGGGMRGISDTFASALWALDTMFELLHSGVSGVNLHTFSGAGYALFDHPAGPAWRVRPEYLGLLAFARAAPAGSQLLRSVPATPATSPAGPLVKVWAMRGGDGRTRVVVINKDHVTHTVQLRGAGVSGARYAYLQRLEASAGAGVRGCPAAYLSTDACATSGVTLGTAAFTRHPARGRPGDRTLTGLPLVLPRLAGRGPGCRACRLRTVRGSRAIPVPPASAVIVTFG